MRFDNLRLSGNPTGLAPAYAAGRDFTAGPNPVQGSLAIRTTVAFTACTVYDAAGRAVYRDAYRPAIDLSALPAGRYFLELSDAAQHKGFHSFIKQ